MARLDEKLAGVYEITNLETGKSYLGKSNGLGAIMRSVKSKLRKGIYHNKSLQSEYADYGIDAYEFIKHFPKENESLSELLNRIKEELVNDDYILHNDIDIIFKEAESIEVDKYRMDNLEYFQRSIVSSLIDAFIDGNVDIYKVQVAFRELGISIDD